MAIVFDNGMLVGGRVSPGRSGLRRSELSSTSAAGAPPVVWTLALVLVPACGATSDLGQGVVVFWLWWTWYSWLCWFRDAVVEGVKGGEVVVLKMVVVLAVEVVVAEDVGGLGGV